jgi:hypothetical protein
MSWLAPPPDAADPADRQALEQAVAAAEVALSRDWRRAQARIKRQISLTRPAQTHPYAALAGGLLLGLCWGLRRGYLLRSST